MVRKKGITFRVIAVGLTLFFMSSFILPCQALAARSSAGGGDLASVDFSKLALGIGMDIAGTIVGGAVKSAVGAGVSSLISGADSSDVFSNMSNAFTNSLSNNFTGVGLLSTVSTGVTNYSVNMNVQRAVAMAGNYYGWSLSKTFLISSILSGAAQGFVNPSVGSFERSISTASIPIDIPITDFIKSSAVGALEGAAKGAAIVAIDANRINRRQDLSMTAKIAGSAAGLTAEALGNYAYEYASNGGDLSKVTGNNLPIYVSLPAQILTQSAAIVATQHINKNVAPLVSAVITGIGAGAMDAFSNQYYNNSQYHGEISANVKAGITADMASNAANNGSMSQIISNTLTPSILKGDRNNTTDTSFGQSLNYKYSNKNKY